MNSILLCDDEKIWLDILEKNVTEYQIKTDWDIQIACKTTSSTELLNYIKLHNIQNGIYFLDINFKSDISGLTLATEIRKIDNSPNLIFITTEDELVMETFRLKLAALDYLVKSSTHLKNDIHSCLAHLEEQFAQGTSSPSKKVIIKSVGGLHSIALSDIYYVETVKRSHKINIYTQNGIILSPITLASFSNSLDNHFIQINKGCYVNMQHIKELQNMGRKIILDNNSICVCSIRDWPHLIQAFKKN